MQINSWNPKDWQIKIGNWEPENPVVKFFLGFFALFISLGIVLLVLLGVVGPVLGFVLLVTLISVLGSLALALLVFLVPLALLVAPFFFIIWLLMLIF